MATPIANIADAVALVRADLRHHLEMAADGHNHMHKFICNNGHKPFAVFYISGDMIEPVCALLTLLLGVPASKVTPVGPGPAAGPVPGPSVN